MKQLLYKLKWLGVLDSPFKLPRLRFYFGRIRHGTPYFLPRKWRKVTPAEAVKSATEAFNNPNLIKKSWGEWYDYYKRCQKPVYIKWFGANLVGLGYKSKFNSWRHEFNPMFSFVAFNRQFCVFVTFGDPMVDMCYWEAWLHYRYDTDRKKSKRERLEQVFKLYSATWGNDNKGYTDYYLDILRKRYKKQRT